LVINGAELACVSFLGFLALFVVCLFVALIEEEFKQRRREKEELRQERERRRRRIGIDDQRINNPHS
jgi:hypothetical protein